MSIPKIKKASPDYDCIVIGGGPAGTTVATIVSKAGFSVLLVEREMMPRSHVGESLMPACNTILKRLGLEMPLQEMGFLRKIGVQFVSDKGNESRPFLFREHDDRETSDSWHIQRDVFDKLLMDNARIAKVTVMQQARVQRVEFDSSGRAKGVSIILSKSETCSKTSRVVVDATGQQAVIANQLGLREFDAARRNAAVWTYYESKTDQFDHETVTIIAKLKKNLGWFWYIPLNKRQVSVGLVGERKHLFSAGRDIAKAFQWGVDQCPAIKGRLAKAKANIAEDFIAARDFAYQTKYSSGDGWLLVGDAKGFIDPVYSTGVFLALKSGELAGDAICHALQVNDTSAEMLAAWIPDYDRRVNWFHRLVDLFYDCDFHFGSFFADHPDQVSTLSNLLMGRIFEMELEPHELFKKITQWKRQQQPLS